MESLNKLQEQTKSYLPLIVIVVFCLLLSFVQASTTMMAGFMGYFFVFLSMFKLFDLKGFVEGFSMYDIVAQKFPPYGYAYPFIELILGLAYLGNVVPWLINILTIIVMGVSAFGVIKSLRSGIDIHCACLGTVLKVPLSTVSLIENIGMAVMALLMLVLH